jgi:hypothetical protein
MDMIKRKGREVDINLTFENNKKLIYFFSKYPISNGYRERKGRVLYIHKTLE